MSGDPPLGCHIPWPYPFPTSPSPYRPADWHPWPQVGTVTFTPTQPDHKLSDSDVDRIARRVVELMRQPEVDPEAQALVDRVVAENQPSAAITRPIRKRRR